jgi:hypothetical protein
LVPLYASLARMSGKGKERLIENAVARKKDLRARQDYNMMQGGMLLAEPVHNSRYKMTALSMNVVMGSIRQAIGDSS